MKYKYLLIFLVMSIWGCTVLPSSFILPKVNQKDKYGSVIGTIALKEKQLIYDGYFLCFTRDSTPQKKNYIHLNPKVFMGAKSDFKDEGHYMYFFDMVATTGNFHITSLKLVTNLASVTYTEEIKLSIPFRIEQGKTFYLGEIQFNSIKDSIYHNYKPKRDIPLAKAKWPLLKIMEN